nr:immunoglobulin heavy chain junction region [Mus musculus]
CARYKGVVDYW